MDFAEILAYMKQGGKVKRPHWGGFWEMQDGTIIIHTKDGEVFDLFDTKMKEYTLDCMAADDFIPAADSNTPILGGVTRMDFSHALHLLKKGVPMKRAEWGNNDFFVVCVDSLKECVAANEEISKFYGMNKGELFHNSVFLVIGISIALCEIWKPYMSDLLAEDWMIVNLKEEER